MLVCKTCRTAQTQTSALSHLQTKHKILRPKKRELQSLFEDVRVATSMVTPQFAAPPVEFEGLLVTEDSFACAHCDRAGSAAYMSNHTHTEIDKPDRKPLIPCATQNLNRGYQMANFRVERRPPHNAPPPLSAEEGLQAIHEEINRGTWKASYVTPEVTDARLISPFLLRTLWHKLVKPYPASELCSLVSADRSDENSWIKKSIHTYFHGALSVADQDTTPELVLQILNSPDPTKECVYSASLRIATD
ncbi:hypothetical protein PQX77_018751 [Marasmius sp. AFHP31]|nr:hypothetical protein PQX77_018751 [Marasmius sp. AFHP31]